MTATVPNNDCVICPKCTWQFRAIPVNVQKVLSVLEDVRGNINPERGFAEELEADVAKLIVELEAQATWVPSGPAAVMRRAAAALATPVVRGEPSELQALFKEALAFGLVYGPVIPSHQWDEMRDTKAKQLAERATPVVQGDSDREETITANPKSWAAWKREAERLAALLATPVVQGEPWTAAECGICKGDPEHCDIHDCGDAHATPVVQGPSDERVRNALQNLYATVKGECPALLDEDRGGNSALAMEIEDIVATPVVQGEPVASIKCALCGDKTRIPPVCDACHDSMGTRAIPAPSPKEAADWIDKLPYGEGMTAMKAAIRAALATRGPIGAVEPIAVLIDFIKTAPGRLPSHVQKAILALSRTPGEEA